ncbi:hypothetical protein QE152_g4726 [Popillia japonica]|uniref:C2H2-type domain-containing protein n=1 Tax=Popillia japonica TaxID=7064 RepID=A0AAW1MZJ1_POPJA
MSETSTNIITDNSTLNKSSSSSRTLNFSIAKIMEPDKKSPKKNLSDLELVSTASKNINYPSQLESAFKKYVPNVLRSPSELIHQYPLVYYPSQLMCVATTSVSVYSVSSEGGTTGSGPTGISVVNSTAPLPEHYNKSCHMKRTMGQGIDSKSTLNTPTSSTKQKSFECVCGKGFCRNFDLKKHMRKLHESNGAPEADYINNPSNSSYARDRDLHHFISPFLIPQAPTSRGPIPLYSEKLL